MSSDQLTVKTRRGILREMIDEILEQNPEMLDNTQFKSDLLGEAVRLDDVIAASFLVNEISADLNPDRLEENPLKLALEIGSLKCVDLLLKNGSMLEGPHWEGRSPAEFVFRGLSTGKSKKMLSTLLDHGLNSKHYDEDLGRNLMHSLVSQLRTRECYHQDAAELVEILLKVGVPLNEMDKCGCTPLVLSLRLNIFDFTSFLVKKGADVNKSSNHIVPLCEAANLKDVNFIELLLLNGANINDKTSNDYSALQIVCKYNCKEAIRLLLRKGADVATSTGKYYYGDGTSLHFLSNKYYIQDISNAKQERVVSIRHMIEEIAKRKSFDEFSVSESDLDYIRKNSSLQEYLEKCENELCGMASFKFYGTYTYYCILKMSKSIKRLAKLIRNEEFVKYFKASTSLFPLYEDDLQYFFDEAMKVKQETEMVYARLKYLFNDYLPDVVIMILGENLNLNNLPLD